MTNSVIANNRSMVIGIDASRNRSGGAKAHLKGILAALDPACYGIDLVHLWAYESLSETIPGRPWLVKHIPAVLQASLLRQIGWQYWQLPREAQALGCDLLFNTDAGSVCPFRPSVTLSQDMLSYEPGEMSRFGFSRARLRLQLLRLVQNRSLRRSHCAMFLTHHAAKVIQQATGALQRHAVIPHGVGEEFRQDVLRKQDSAAFAAGIRIVYVSNAALYKHQWHVVRAVGQLQRNGRPVTLLLIGGGKGRAQKVLDVEIATTDPDGHFVRQLPFVPHREIPRYLAEADIFVFASSCENMPITLLEAMAMGLPIACSDRGPMPEVLQDGGVYFNPEDSDSIARAINSIIENPTLKACIANRARELSEQYTWTRCASETWTVLGSIARESRAA